MALKNSQYDAIMREYNQTQFKNRRLWDLRVSELYDKCPEFEQIDNQIASLSIEQGKKLVNGEIDVLDNLKEQIAALTKKRTELLESLGYTSNYLDPIYTCPDCQDTGYSGNRKCHCFRKAAIEMLYTSSNLKEILQSENFNNYTYRYYSDDFKDASTGLTALAAAKRAYTQSKNFVDTFDDEFNNFYFKLYCQRTHRYFTFRYLF
jgi:DNA replication protein DnaC